MLLSYKMIKVINVWQLLVNLKKKVTNLKWDSVFGVGSIFTSAELCLNHGYIMNKAISLHGSLRN